MSIGVDSTPEHPSENGIEDENEENITELQEDWGDEYNDVVTLLCGLHLNKYVDMFVRQGITLEIFRELTEEDLCHVGMTNAQHRASLLHSLDQLRRGQVEAVREVQQTELTPEEVKLALTNTLKHLTVIHASLAHSRLNLRKPSVHNSLVTLTVTSAELLERLTQMAYVEAQLVGNQLDSILSKKTGYTPKSSPIRWKVFNIAAVSTVGIVCALLYTIKRS